MRLIPQSLLALLLLAIPARPAAAGGAVDPAAISAPSPVHVPFLEGRPFAEAMRRARAEKKPILLDVVASWCGPCKLMDRTTFADAGIVDWAKGRVIPVRVDAEKGEGRKLSARYAVRSFPTILFLDAGGGEIDRMMGAIPASEFRRNADKILEGNAPLAEGLKGLKAKWNAEAAYGIAQTLAERNDPAKLHPIAVRLLGEDPDLVRPETLRVFTYLVALEDLQDKVVPETADMIVTYLPRLGNDQARGLMSIVLARQRARDGNVAEVRQIVDGAMSAFGDPNPYTDELLAALGNAQKQSGKLDDAVATFRRAAEKADAGGSPSRAARQLDLAEALLEAGRTDDGQKAIARALEIAGGDEATLVRTSRLFLKLKAPTRAVEQARRAVAFSQGEDPESQAALGAALAAGGATGAAAAWRRASELAPENAEYRRRLDGLQRKRASKAS